MLAGLLKGSFMYKIVNRKKIRSLRKMGFWKRRLSNLERPRLCVFRSNLHIQAQIIDDLKKTVIVSASSMEKSLRALSLSGKTLAEKIGTVVAERAKTAGVSKIIFDKNGYNYHGRIKVLADAARAGGLDF